MAAVDARAAEYEDRVALVTGASAGFGAAIAERLHRLGARVVLAGRRTERLLEVQRGFDPSAARSMVLTLDIAAVEAAAAAVAALPPAWQDIAVLVNNAGLALGSAPVPEVSLQDWDTMIATNIRGTVHLTHHIARGMVARGLGHIVNLGSVAGTYPYRGGNVYGASKAFLHQFSLGLRADLHGTGVRVTSIEPGMAETEFSLVRFRGDAAQAEALYAGMTPLSPADIADAVAYAVTAPRTVNVNRIELMPTDQSFAGFAVHRRSP